MDTEYSFGAPIIDQLFGANVAAIHRIGRRGFRFVHCSIPQG
jgi:hypothetical protein